MSDIIIRDARTDEAAILEVRAAFAAMRNGDRQPVGDVALISFEGGHDFLVKRTKTAYVVSSAPSR